MITFNTLFLIIVTTSGIRTHSINMHIYVVQVTYNIIHKYMLNHQVDPRNTTYI